MEKLEKNITKYIIVLLLWLLVTSNVCSQHLIFLSAVDTDELLAFLVRNYTTLNCVVDLLFSLGVTFVSL